MPHIDLDAVFSALSHVQRRALVSAFSGGRRDVSELAAQTGIPEAAVVRHLRTLVACGLVRLVPRHAGQYEVHQKAWDEFRNLVGSVAARDEPAEVPPPLDRDEIDAQADAWARHWPDEDRNVYVIGRRLLRLAGHVQRALNEAAASQGLLAAELLLLDALANAGPPFVATPTQLQRSLEMTPGGVTKCIQRLEGVGLVRRMPDPDDGRGVRVAMLPPADQLQKNILSTGLYGADWVASQQLTPARRSSLAELLRELLAHADAEARRRKSQA